MSSIVAVLDSSAMLCLLHREPGMDKVAGHIAGGHVAMSAVNYCEVMGKLIDLNKDIGKAAREMQQLDIQLMTFDEQQALSAAELRRTTRNLGLSLGDRSFLALANHPKAVAVTADSAWKAVEPYCRVDLIR